MPEWGFLWHQQEAADEEARRDGWLPVSWRMDGVSGVQNADGDTSLLRPRDFFLLINLSGRSSLWL